MYSIADLGSVELPELGLLETYAREPLSKGNKQLQAVRNIGMANGDKSWVNLED